MKLRFDPKTRILVLAALMLLGFGVLTAKLFYEQIHRGERHRERISRQSLRRIRIPARRGKIFTRDLVPLADNSDQCSLLLYPEELRQPGRRQNTVNHIQEVAVQLAAAIGRPPLLSGDDIAYHLRTRPGLPLELFRELTPEEQARALEYARTRRGINLEPSSVRRYPAGRLACHLVGYTRPEEPAAADDRRDFFYYVADEVGKSGLEAAFDRCPELPENIRALRGYPGYSLVRVDSLGFVRQTLIEEIEPLNGNHLITTLDSRAQRFAEEALQGFRGVLVLLDADTGEILAAASNPGYDLARFSPRLTQEYYSSLLNNPDKPLFNRALQGVFSPGSIVKPLVALALLKQGVDPKETVHCDGYNRIGNQAIRCTAYRIGGHGDIDLETALEKSCNSYFIQQGLKYGVGAITELFAAAGLGREPELELPAAAGQLPDPERKRRLGQGRWNAFDTGLISIGQGMITVSPLQAALFAAALGNGGKLMQPRLVRALVDQHGNELLRYRPRVVGTLPVTPEQLEVVRRGMWRVVHAPRGSGRRAANPVIELYGKTGSAELGSLANRTQDVWFICFGSADGRNYAAAVVLQGGQAGGSDCAPLISEFFTRLLTRTES